MPFDGSKAAYRLRRRSGVLAPSIRRQYERGKPWVDSTNSCHDTRPWDLPGWFDLVPTFRDRPSLMNRRTARTISS
jgi:hypothetical protein